jgi:hypothetical protein
LSRIGEKLQRLRKPGASMGFGFSTAPAERRRMLLFVRFGVQADTGESGSSLDHADVAVVGAAEGDCSAFVELAAQRCPSAPVGCWVDPGASLPDIAKPDCCDFFVCDAEGPVQVLERKDIGCLVRVDSGIESSRLRATAELGIDGVVLTADSLDLSRLSSLVECRRVHMVSGKPVVLQVGGLLESPLIALLWRSGVDALLVDSSVGVKVLAALSAAMDSAPYEARAGGGGSSAVIGAHIGALGVAEVHEEGDGGGGEEEEEDD